jgi:DNA polymerase I-like protein with 3'-5' exonuclease and polymerase domains
MNRAAIAVWKRCRENGWTEVKLVMNVHDEVILEGPEELANEMAILLKDCMENTTILPGVKLIAKPVIAKTIGDLK